MNGNLEKELLRVKFKLEVFQFMAVGVLHFIQILTIGVELIVK